MLTYGGRALPVMRRRCLLCRLRFQGGSAQGVQEARRWWLPRRWLGDRRELRQLLRQGLRRRPVHWKIHQPKQARKYIRAWSTKVVSSLTGTDGAAASRWWHDRQMPSLRSCWQPVGTKPLPHVRVDERQPEAVLLHRMVCLPRTYRRVFGAMRQIGVGFMKSWLGYHASCHRRANGKGTFRRGYESVVD